MRRKAFIVRAIWDDEAGVYYSNSDIIGLHVEAKTSDEFEELIHEYASELVVANHLEEIADKNTGRI
jgi:hypothetical protein